MKRTLPDTVESNVNTLMAMGFTESQAKKALELAENQLDVAVELILTIPADNPPEKNEPVKAENEGEKGNCTVKSEGEVKGDSFNKEIGIKVTFQRHYEYEETWDDPDNISPYISLLEYEEDALGQRYPDEVVIPMQKIEIEYVTLLDFNRFRFNYPLEKPVIRSFVADTANGFTRAFIARKVGETYKSIYAEEEAVAGNPGHLPGMNLRFFFKSKRDGKQRKFERTLWSMGT